jgi:GMP synthase (glutamine-hydrolysing)
MGMKIYVVDNGGQWTHREWRVLRELDAETKIIPNTTPFDKLDVQGLVLSGGAPRAYRESMKLGRTREYLEKASFPILAICVAHQFLAMHFGGSVAQAELPEYGKVELFVDEKNELFQDLPTKFYVWESHNDEVKKVTSEFVVLAHSENCKIQAIKYKRKPFYGLQFHPEVEHTEHGYEIFKNFLALCKDFR